MGGEAGDEDMEFPGVLKKEHVKIPGVNLKRLEFPGVIKKKSCRISMGLGFWRWNFQVVSHNFADFPRVKLCFLQNFQKSSDKSKNSRGFSKTYVLNPRLDFSSNSPREVLLYVLW